MVGTGELVKKKTYLSFEGRALLLSEGPSVYGAKLLCHHIAITDDGRCRRPQKKEADVRWTKDQVTIPIPAGGLRTSVVTHLSHKATRVKDTYEEGKLGSNLISFFISLNTFLYVQVLLYSFLSTENNFDSSLNLSK